jgi:hypothetical protein
MTLSKDACSNKVGRYLCWWTISPRSYRGLLVPEVIIRPVVSVLALTSFIRYIWYWNLEFLNNVIIIKTKVLLPQAWVTLAKCVRSSLGPLVYLLRNFLILFGFPDFRLWEYLMKVIPETRHAHWIWYLRVYVVIIWPCPKSLRVNLVHFVL